MDRLIQVLGKAEMCLPGIWVGPSSFALLFTGVPVTAQRNWAYSCESARNFRVLALRMLWSASSMMSRRHGTRASTRGFFAVA